MGLENDQFCWHSLLYLCWHSGGWLKKGQNYADVIHVWSLTRHELDIVLRWTVHCVCFLLITKRPSICPERKKFPAYMYWTKLSYWSIYYIFRPQPSSLDLQETILYFLKHSQETGAILEVPLHTMIFSPKFVSYFNVKGSH